jgi:hypothetical protein
LLTNFDNEIDTVFNETLAELQKYQREATNLLFSPIEKIKLLFEDMANKRMENVYL